MLCTQRVQHSVKHQNALRAFRVVRMFGHWFVVWCVRLFATLRLKFTQRSSTVRQKQKSGCGWCCREVSTSTYSQRMSLSIRSRSSRIQKCSYCFGFGYLCSQWPIFFYLFLVPRAFHLYITSNARDKNWTATSTVGRRRVASSARLSWNCSYFLFRNQGLGRSHNRPAAVSNVKWKMKLNTTSYRPFQLDSDYTLILIFLMPRIDCTRCTIARQRETLFRSIMEEALELHVISKFRMQRKTRNFSFFLFDSGSASIQSRFGGWLVVWRLHVSIVCIILVKPSAFSATHWPLINFIFSQSVH